MMKDKMASNSSSIQTIPIIAALKAIQLIAVLQSVHIRPWKTISQHNIASGRIIRISKYFVWTKYFDRKQTLLGCHILSICRLCPDAILRPDEIFSMDVSGVTVKIEKIKNLRKSVLSKDVLEKTDFFQNAKKSIL